MNDQLQIARRYLECTAFVLLWVAGGYYLHLSAIAYQVAGIALVAGFQIAIARRPVWQLWARDVERLRVDWQTAVLAVGLFAVCEGIMLLHRGRVGKGPDGQWFLWLLVFAALPAAVGLRAQTPAHLRRALPAMGIAIAIRLAWRIGWAPTWDGPVTFPPARLPDFFADFICEFVALFLVDEVAFRGALDPHLCPAGSSRVQQWASAVFGSILWTVWHFPAYNPGAKSFAALLTQAPPQVWGAVVFGPALAFCARRSRTLAPSAAIHAAGNAYVLTLMK